MPHLVRPLVDVPGETGVTLTETRAPNPEQIAAIEETGVVFVSAGAGTGKTTVLVERFVKAVCERGALARLGPRHHLHRTGGRRAAEQDPSGLVELGRHDLAREIDRAWISTIHGFCSRLLRAPPVRGRPRPRFRVLDASQPRVLRSEAFEAALAAFCGDREPERLRLLATYGAARLASMLTGCLRAASLGGPATRARAGEGVKLAEPPGRSSGRRHA